MKKSARTKSDTATSASSSPTYLIEPMFDSDGVQQTAGIDTLGREHLDPQPFEVPLGMRQSPGIEQLIKDYVRRELSQFAADNQFETFEEADDFEIEDDPLDELTPYERVFDPPRPLEEAAGALKDTPPLPKDPPKADPGSSPESPLKPEVTPAPSQEAGGESKAQ